MDTQVIKEEITSRALREVVDSLIDVIDRVETGETSHQRAIVEITGHKHVLQSIALDWAFNRKPGIFGKRVKQIEG